MGSRQHQVPKRQAQAYQRLLGLQPIEREHYGQSVPDGQNELFIAEYKARAHTPHVLKQAFEQLDSYTNSQDERIPIVLFHHIGDQHHKDLVILRVSDFRELLQKLRLWEGGE